MYSIVCIDTIRIHRSQLTSLTPDKKLDLVLAQQLTHTRTLRKMLSFKIVVVGDSGVGKTTLLYANMCNKFVSQIYGLFDTQSIHAMTPDGKPYSFELWDTIREGLPEQALSKSWHF